VAGCIREVREILAEVDFLTPRPHQSCHRDLPIHQQDQWSSSQTCNPHIMATTATSGSEYFTATLASYPARTKTASSSIKGLQTIATAVDFADKIFITVTQNGRLAHWVNNVYVVFMILILTLVQVHIPLDIAATDASMFSNPHLDRDDDDPNSDLLPMHHLTATTILGGTIPQLEVLGQTLATQVASAIKTRNDRETRMVVVGMGLDKSMVAREEFSELVGLVLGVI
jgi:proteasome assembly chaperone 3